MARAIESALREHGKGIEASLWLGGSRGDAWFEMHAGTARPTASAIKTFYLVELFARYHDRLDEPLPGVAEVIEDDHHPAVSHFSPDQREEIRRDLGKASARRVGEVMMGKAKVSNAVYNAAANVTTAIFGGPEQLMQAVHKRDAAFKDVAVRRYMLRDRRSPGDNEATAAAMAALYQRLASGRLSGIDEDTLKAIREVLLQEDDPKLGSRYMKGGSLDTDPMTLVYAGWWQTRQGPIVYVVMARQPSPGGKDRKAAADALRQTTRKLNDLIVSAGRQALQGP